VPPHRPTGYVPNPKATEKFVSSLRWPTLAEAGPGLKADDNSDVVLWPAILKVKPSYSRVAQAIGSCVGHGWAGSVDCLSSTEIVVHGEAEDWPGRCLEASIYALSRCEARGQTRNYGGDGSYGAAAAKAVTQFGCLHYGVDYKGQIFNEYSGVREKQWGSSGLPDELEPFAKQRRVKTTTLVQNFSQLCKAISNGYPVAQASVQGFTFARDKDGFCKANNAGWAHCTAFIGKRMGKRPGALYWQSWGPRSNSGPHYSGLPAKPDSMPPAFVGCTFWVDADIVDRMLGQEDSFSLSGYDGFPARKLPRWTGGIL
jgi:hypothetical protein